MEAESATRPRPLPPLLRMAVLSGVRATVELHIRRSGDVNSVDDRGRSPLMLAASRGHADICGVLLEAGADPTHKDQAGNDALSVATSAGHADVITLLSRLVTADPNGAQHSRPRRADGEERPWTGDRIEPCAADEGGLLPFRGAAAIDTRPEPIDSDSGSGNKPTLEEPCGQPGAPLVGFEPVMPASHPVTDPYVEAFDLSAWEPASEAPPPPSDPSCAVDAGALQRRMSQHVPIDMDDDWSDVDLDLPEIVGPVSRRIRLDRIEEWNLRRLVVAALRDGRVRGEAIAAVSPRDEQDGGQPDALFEANLRVALGDAGVVIDDDPAAPEPAVESGSEDNDAAEDDELYGDDASDILAFLGRLNSSDADPLSSYMAGLPKDRLSRDDETNLGKAIEEGTIEALTAIAGCPAAVDELAAAVRAVLSGQIPFRQVLEVDEPDGAEPREDDEDDPAAGPEPDAEPGAAPVPNDLLSRVDAVRDLCHSISTLPRAPEKQRLARELGSHLFALDLTPEFMARLYRMVLDDADGTEPRQQLLEGLGKARTAKIRLVQTNLRLVVWVATKWGGLDLLDRIQEGNLGLLKAVDRFDHRRGAKFSTYAVWWIRQSISRAIEDTSRTIRIPVHAGQDLRRIRRAKSDSVRDLSTEELAQATELPLHVVKRLLPFVEEPPSIDADEERQAIEEIADDRTRSPADVIAETALRAGVRNLLECLTPKELEIVRRRFGLDCDEHTLEEIGQILGVTRERIRQIEAKALRKLGNPARSKTLRAFL